MSRGRPRRRAPAWLLAAALAPASLAARAQDVPLWEVGIGAIGLRFPYYRGSDQSANLILPLPYLIYRGKVFRSDSGGIRGVLFNTQRLELNVSFGGSLPVTSRDSDTRAGMPDLQPEVELGPAFDWTVWRGANQGTRLVASLPLRQAIALEWPPRSLGWISNPNLSLDLTDPARFPHAQLGLQVGPLFSTRHLNDYYYTVTPNFATAARPQYAAPGGYSGWQLGTTASKRLGPFWIAAFARYDSVHGAVFEHSPLVRSGSSLYGGLGVAYVFKESATRVPRSDTDF